MDFDGMPVTVNEMDSIVLQVLKNELVNMKELESILANIEEKEEDHLEALKQINYFEKAIDNFRERTRNDIAENIEYLEKTGLLAKEFYVDSKPVGIFAIVNKSEDELLDYYIGSVTLSFFTRINRGYA